MKSGSNDNLAKALTLLEETARNGPISGRRASRNARAADLAELFLAELRVRRAHLKEWIELLNEAANDEVPLPVRGTRANPGAPRMCRGRRVRPAA